jgi:hypothetical protein
MGMRLKVYQRRAKRHLAPGEEVKAAIHAHTSWILMMAPEYVHYFFGRSIVVTDQRTLLLGPGMRDKIDEWAPGQANASVKGIHILLGGDKYRFFIGLAKKRGANQVAKAANAA